MGTVCQVLEEKSEVVINKPLSMKSHANTKLRTTSRAFQSVFEQEDLHITNTHLKHKSK